MKKKKLKRVVPPTIVAKNKQRKGRAVEISGKEKFKEAGYIPGSRAVIPNEGTL